MDEASLLLRPKEFHLREHRAILLGEFNNICHSVQDWKRRIYKKKQYKNIKFILEKIEKAFTGMSKSGMRRHRMLKNSLVKPFNY
jgi:hypothetical protein